ncbi:MAG: ABC transporter ATP-binding protein [Campylobacteraceae bacterium]|nr:ABC transporter ATP-binding protein [Campylobacteraceae bacterium]
MIEVKNITKIFNEGTNREVTILKDLSFTVKEKETFFLTGVSGSGKSTVLALIAGLYKPTSGDIIINGESMTKLSLKYASKFRRENIGIIFQSFNLIPTLTVMDNILLPTLPDMVDRRDRAMEMLENLHLTHRKNTLAKFLSGGEQQRVAIIRALINDPDVILADEPTANLDKGLSEKLLEYFSMMKDKTIIISTHDSFLLESGLADSRFDLKKV